MSNPTQAQVFQAVLTLVTNVTFTAPVKGWLGWNTPPSSRLRMWTEVDSSTQPTAFLVTHREVDEFRNLNLLRRRLELGLWCLVDTGAEDAQGAFWLESMLDGVRNAVNSPDDWGSGANTLGGLVYWCRIEGRVLKDPGDIDSQALMIIPIMVEMP